MEAKLGKIESVSFGIGGYKDACIGLMVTLSFGDSPGVCDSKTAWDANIIQHSKHCKWTEEDRNKSYAEIVRYVSDLLSAAKVKDVASLKGKPVQAMFDGNKLESWRILKEVL